MSSPIAQLSLLSAVILQLLAAGNSYAASAHAGGLFEMSELPGLSSTAVAEIAAKCGSGSCGSKEDGKNKKDDKHKCGSDAGKDKKDAKHKCGTKKESTHKCGAGSCGAKTKETH